MDKKKKQAAREKVLEVLNQARAMELHAIHQYMNQHYNLDDQDYGALAANIKLVAIDEMRHSEMFAERIKELGGEPTAEPAMAVTKRQAVEAVFPFDADLEDDTMVAYNRFATVCQENGDSISKKLFEAIIEEEQAHYNYFDDVGGHIEKLGAAYLAQIAGTPADTGPGAQGFVARAAGGGAAADAGA